MPKNAEPSRPLTIRDVPAPLGVCDSCGATPALPEVGEAGGRSFYHCARCALREALRDAAGAHLEQLAAPILGVWADHWSRAGLSLPDLLGVLESLTGNWAAREYAHASQLRALRFLRMKHRPAPYVDPGPARYTLDLEQLPTLEARQEADPARGRLWPSFTVRNADGTRSTYDEAPGLDLLTLEQPDGSAVLLPLGYRGEVDPERAFPHAVRIPARLRRAARAVYYARGEEVPARPEEGGGA